MLHPIHPSVQEPRPEEAGLLDSWLAARAASDMDVIRDRETYDHMWSTWCGYLHDTGQKRGGKQPIRWFDVTPEIAKHFLDNGPVNRKVRIEASKSQTTKYRYWRLLDRIYNFAKAKRWIDANPLAGIEEGDRPLHKDTEGSTLDPKVWAAAERLLAKPEKFDAVSVRNRAILQLLFALGLAPLEIRGMQLTTLVFEAVRGEGKRVVAVQTDGPGTLRPRRLPLRSCQAEVVEEWLKVRPLIATEASGELLFCTPKGPVSSVSLFLLVQSFLTKASEEAGRPEPAQSGPQTIRNSLLARLLNSGEHSAVWVATFAGLKNAKGLDHLLHVFNEPAKLSWQKARAGRE
ncbi:hypothetical protein [Acidovorax sp. sic0104]|uniref:tyrosine-type recombinase/integrase n=1 Tax=Acidovorax sp. sic0104 TaxID=2854784 RepID=UPI001C448AEF|nr:hypothetical protein [Acidovorax sp. sic0104]MBV7541946.1 hypothetical protein [Acidovorax sp. sic0104]